MGKSILIVEDEQNIVDILSFNLSREGYDTLEAYDGPTGLQLALEQDPDLILLDLMLPGMDGFEVCRQVRESGSSTPIIMLTAREEETDKVLGLELGADDYITKPFLPQELLLRLAAVLRRVYGAGAGEVLRLGAADVHWAPARCAAPAAVRLPSPPRSTPCSKSWRPTGETSSPSTPCARPCGRAHGGL